jgi:hypothetical protein
VTAIHSGFPVAAHAADSDGPLGGAAGALAGAWLTSYTDYLRRAADQSSSTLGLYQEITDRIARGQLAPTVTEDLLGSFVQTRGVAYSEELAQLNLRFFSEMVRIGTAYAGELGHAVLPEGPTLPTPPPYDGSDPAGWFVRLGEYGRQLGETAGAAYQALIDRAAAGEAAHGDVQQKAAEYLEQRLPEYLSELGKLYFELLNGLTDLRVRSEQEFLSGVIEHGDHRSSDSFSMTLTAPLGEAATAFFTLANTRDENARIRCDIGDVRRQDGIGPAFSPDMTVVPDDLELVPGEEARFELTVRLDGESYEPDVPYVGVLRIAGHGDPRLEVPLRIVAAKPGATPEQ